MTEPHDGRLGSALSHLDNAVYDLTRWLMADRTSHGDLLPRASVENILGQVAAMREALRRVAKDRGVEP